jgi:hypothetical protein
LKKKEKIQKNFDCFFEHWEEDTRRPTDFKNFKRSIYNILCHDYKNHESKKIDRDYILNTFISEKNKENFDHTNIYNKK